MNLEKGLKAVHNSASERTSCRVFIANKSANRKVLIVADEPSIENLLTLVKKLDSRRAAAPSTRIDLSTVDRRSFDTAILDLRCSQERPASRGYGIGEVWPSMVGKVLVINAEVHDQKTFELVERYIHHRHSTEGFLFGLARIVRSLFGHSPSPNEI
ncbi:MAG: hypothetical protein EPN47_20265 [Acidobacteria bacterium]|nr:MAG: hypothetical protein EPN47_20265 [Acidobacteriota bacterium]